MDRPRRSRRIQRGDLRIRCQRELWTEGHDRQSEKLLTRHRLSLDASNPVAVWAARRFFHLPYQHATMTVDVSQAGVDYRSVRRPAPVAFEASYRATDVPYTTQPGSLEHWLTERYCLYAQDGGRILRCEVHHRPWPLQRAEATIRRNELLKPHGMLQPDTRPLLHFAKRLEVITWAPVRLKK